MRRFSICAVCSVALAGVFAVACQDSPTATEQTQQISGDVVTADTDGFAVGPVPPTSGPAVRFSVAASSGDVILPAAYATKMGQIANTFPHARANMRYQQVFLGSEIGGPRQYRELCLRLDETFGGPAQVQQITLKLGPTNLDHTNLGTSFAGNYSAPSTRPVAATGEAEAHLSEPRWIGRYRARRLPTSFPGSNFADARIASRRADGRTSGASEKK